MHDIFGQDYKRTLLIRYSKRFDTWIFHIAYNMCKNEYRKMTVRDEYHESQIYRELYIDENGRKQDRSSEILGRIE